METITLKYGNTFTYFINGLLIDTDMAGTMTPFLRELKRNGITTEDIRYVFATHYHPDHSGLIGELTQNDAKLLLLEHQREYVHSSDHIFARIPNLRFVPADESKATVVTPGESRDFLASLGISGEILPTKSHSPDGAALLLDDGNAFVGDVEPREYIGGYSDNPALQKDWESLLSHGAKTIHYAHIPERSSEF